MSEWDRNYHHGNKPKLKATLMTIAVVAATFVGVTIAEQLVYSMTFPKSSRIVELDGIFYSVHIELGYCGLFIGIPSCIRGIVLIAENNLNDDFPSGVNATQVWLIPTKGGIWPWKDYEIFSLRFDGSNYEHANYEFILGNISLARDFIYFDVIVEVNGTGGIFYYLFSEIDNFPL